MERLAGSSSAVYLPTEKTNCCYHVYTKIKNETVQNTLEKHWITVRSVRALLTFTPLFITVSVNILL